MLRCCFHLCLSASWCVHPAGIMSFCCFCWRIATVLFNPRVLWVSYRTPVETKAVLQEHEHRATGVQFNTPPKIHCSSLDANGDLRARSAPPLFLLPGQTVWKPVTPSLIPTLYRLEVVCNVCLATFDFTWIDCM